MKIIPLHNHVVIKQEDETETMYGNLIVPDAGKEKPLMGEVISSGPGIINMNGVLIPNNLKPGDKVAFPSFGGQKLTILGEEYLVYKEQDILCILEDNKEPPLILPKTITKELLNNTDKLIISKEEEEEIKEELLKALK